MEGILFEYRNGKPDRYFGNIETRPVQTQMFDSDGQIVNLAVEDSLPDFHSHESGSITSASSIDRPNFLAMLMVSPL